MKFYIVRPCETVVCGVCSGAVGADPAGGPGEDRPVPQRLPAGSRREDAELRHEYHFIPAQSHARLL